MGSAAIPSAAAAALLVFLACGGGNPPPKDENDVIAYKGPQTTDSDRASIALPQGGAPATSNASPAGTSSAPTSDSTSTSTSTSAAPTEEEELANVHHQIAADEVSKTVAKVKAKIQACYKAGLKRDPSCTGEVKIRFVVKHDGTMVDAQDQGSSMNDEEITKCIADVIKTLKFPVQQSPGPAFGIYSIHLSP
jgi:hypothetical protein